MLRLRLGALCPSSLDSPLQPHQLSRLSLATLQLRCQSTPLYHLIHLTPLQLS
jgi:hypothetical protein